MRRLTLVLVLGAALALFVVPAALAAASPPGGSAGFTPGLERILSATDGVTYGTDGYTIGYGDGVTVAGAPFFPDSKTGTAVIFYQVDGVARQQRVAPSDGAVNDMFAEYTVAATGDTVVVGSSMHQVGSSFGQGAVYVYGLVDGEWVEQVILSTEDPLWGEQFGTSVAISGDTLVVGAAGHNEGAIEGCGAVYVFTRTGGAWQQTAVLTASDPQWSAVLGWRVALDGDTIVATAPNADGAGAAYVFVRSGGVWSQQAKLSGTGVVQDDGFGQSCACGGDGGFAVIGAPETDSRSGAAYVFTRSGAAWSQTDKLTLPSSGAARGDVVGDPGGPDFGHSVAASGENLVVGAPSQHLGDGDVGAAYVYSRSGGAWGAPLRLTSSLGGYSLYGLAAAMQGNSIAIGAPSQDIGSNPGQGCVFLTIPAVGPSVRMDGAKPGWQKRADVTFTATEAEGGAPVAATQYRPEGETEWTSGDSLAIGAQGRTRIQYRAIDVNGVAGDTHARAVRVDSKRPRVEAPDATARSGARLRLVFNATDFVPGCGRAVVRLRIEDARGHLLRRASTWPVTTNARHTLSVTRRLAPGTYRLVWRATDAAGNVQKHVTVSTLRVL
jgi:hypothetical protein